METATSTTTGRAVRDEASLSAPQKAKREEPMLVKLRAVEATPGSFASFGQSIAASPDGDQFGPHDAHLDLSRDIPRFYIMRLERKHLKFSAITHHAGVTQCLLPSAACIGTSAWQHLPSWTGHRPEWLA